MLICFSPALVGLTGTSVHDAGTAGATATEGGIQRLWTFNRQWLDLCFSTGSLQEDFALTDAEKFSDWRPTEFHIEPVEPDAH